MFDKDKNGRISSDEVGVVMKSLGMDPKQEELDNMIKEVDQDGKCV